MQLKTRPKPIDWSSFRKLHLPSGVASFRSPNQSFETLEKQLDGHNLPQPKQRNVDPHLHRVVSAFPPVAFAMAYGSGIFRQSGYDEEKKPMLDFVFGVHHSRHWHWQNLKRHPHHYSAVKHLGTWTLDVLQRNLGARVYYNTNVEVDGIRIKYGVVDMSDLTSDLMHWDTMYIAGRMQKPVHIIACKTDLVD
jgi:translocator assembly and maintenance protein 41